MHCVGGNSHCPALRCALRHFMVLLTQPTNRHAYMLGSRPFMDLDRSFISFSALIFACVRFSTSFYLARTGCSSDFAFLWRPPSSPFHTISPKLSLKTATKLWSYCQRPGDKYGRRESCEVAAATAERLFRRGLRRERERDRDGYGGYDYEYGDDSTVLGGGYSSSDDSEGRRKRKNRRRRRSSVGLGYGGGGMGAVSAGQLISAQAAAGGYTPGYGGQQLGLPGAGAGGYGLSPNMGGGLAMPGVGYQPGTVAASPYLGAGYAAAGVGQQQAAYQPAYGVAGMGAPGYGGVPGGGLGVPQVGRPRSSSFGYPASPTYY